MDSSIVSDPAFKLVARSLGVHPREIYGACFLLWLACYERRSECLSKAEADACADLEHFAQALVDAQLATEDGDNIIVHGVVKRIQFLNKQREKGAAGGKKSRAKSAPSKPVSKGSSKPEANAKQMLTQEPAPAQAYTPSPAPTQSPTPALDQTESGKPTQFSLTHVDASQPGPSRAVAIRVWDEQENLRAEAIPGSRRLKPTDERLERIEERLAEGASEEDCLHVLRYRAAMAATGDANAVKYFNGTTNWRKDNFEFALAQPMPERSMWTPMNGDALGRLADELRGRGM